MQRQNGATTPDTRTSGGFESLGLHADLLRAVRDLGFDRPTPIQAEAIPAGLERKDVLACAATGSGKTAAFLLPILQRLREQPKGATRALILTPTRELAAQIQEHFEQLSRHTRLTGAAIYGGVGMGPQESALRRGVDVLVATPGRLIDHFERGNARLDQLDVLVLDEADRMLDMGFLPAIKRIMGFLPKRPRQTLLFSATMPPEIKSLASQWQRDPVGIAIERRQEPAKGIAQALYPVPQTAKPALLVELLRRGDVGNVIVFCRTKHRANRLAQKLEKQGISVARIHGNRSQKQRTEALEGFKDGRYKVLVATDIVARGIDVEALDHVVNFDVPNVPDDYIHRVGRTGRAELTGEAYTFVSPDEETHVRGIERAVGKKIERRTVDGFDYRQGADEKLEIPLEERIAAIRAQRREERARSAAKAERRDGSASGRPGESSSRGSGPGGRSQGPRHQRPAGVGGRGGRGGRSGRGGRRSGGGE